MIIRSIEIEKFRAFQQASWENALLQFLDAMQRKKLQFLE